jgi:ABC-type multidrug transport system permease subunit
VSVELVAYPRATASAARVQKATAHRDAFGSNTSVPSAHEVSQSNYEVFMFLALFVVLVVCWVFGFVIFHVAGGLIHALLIVAAISLIWHFVGPRPTT